MSQIPPPPSGPAPNPPPDRQSPTYQGPARTAHGPVYWIFVGWWLAPMMWLGRVFLWLLAWPLGLWRSMARSRKKRELRERRGYRDQA